MTDNSNPRLACYERWGGNRKAEFPVDLPGLSGWVSSCPLNPDAGGGDVHYLSVCSHGRVSRIALADVAGHGPSANSLAENLRAKLSSHTDNWDQSALMRELSDAFHEGQTQGWFATAAVLGFYVETSELLFTNAGHPPALWYRAREGTWDYLQDCTQFAQSVQDLPLGIIPGTKYSQTAVRLGANDLLLLYTDGITETRNEAGGELGQNGLLDLARKTSPELPVEFGRALLAGVRDFRGPAPRRDDETIVVLKRQGAE
jgi:phosphoserine phosphatase RsbU/P